MVAREKGLGCGTSSLEKITEFIVSRRPYGLAAPTEDGWFYASLSPPPLPRSFSPFWSFYRRNCVHKSADTVMPVLTSRRLYRTVGGGKRYSGWENGWRVEIEAEIFIHYVLIIIFRGRKKTLRIQWRGRKLEKQIFESVDLPKTKLNREERNLEYVYQNLKIYIGIYNRLKCITRLWRTTYSVVENVSLTRASSRVFRNEPTIRSLT